MCESNCVVGLLSIRHPVKDFHRGWKATISLTSQVMMLHLIVNCAVLVRETLPLILPCLRELREEHSKSQGKGVRLSNYTSHKLPDEEGTSITKFDWKARLVDLDFAKEWTPYRLELVTELYFAIHHDGGASRLDSLMCSCACDSVMKTPGAEWEQCIPEIIGRWLTQHRSQAWV